MAEMIRADASKFAFFEAADVGKTYHRTLGYSIPQAIDGFEYHAGKAREIGGEVRAVPERGFFNYRLWEPMGVVAEILPWNGPFMMACQKVSAILAAGNTVVIKPAQDGSLSNRELANGEKFGTIAITEPDAGSDIGGITTSENARATRGY